MKEFRRIFISTCIGTSASFSGATASPNPHFMVEYHVNMCGFSTNDASKVSKLLPHIQSTEKSDVFLRFFKSQGFDGANMRRIISWKPRLFSWDVETNLTSKFKLLSEMSLFEFEIVDVVRLHPIIMSRVDPKF
ncbi:hypothetical protein ZIOFF_060976 [Zingiber officinale]|uniref:Uncharacterized protein n=1 Tax=Zingiber officinale TaxID=94328 RepID=A0A8J5FBC9_ZINOF|nr:hypothetical protein ZIOFF_060976 [Zingiber officinale]